MRGAVWFGNSPPDWPSVTRHWRVRDFHMREACLLCLGTDNGPTYRLTCSSQLGSGKNFFFLEPGVNLQTTDTI